MMMMMMMMSLPFPNVHNLTHLVQNEQDDTLTPSVDVDASTRGKTHSNIKPWP